jgi:hypothetical protein
MQKRLSRHGKIFYVEQSCDSSYTICFESQIESQIELRWYRDDCRVSSGVCIIIHKKVEVARTEPVKLIAAYFVILHTLSNMVEHMTNTAKSKNSNTCIVGNISQSV